MLTGTNVYTGGTTVGSGTLTVAATSATPGYATTGDVYVSNGATMAVYPTGSWNAAAIGNLLAAGSATFAAGANIGIDTTYANFTYPASIGNTVGGALGLVLSGTNTLVLSAANTYSGGTMVNAGTLLFGNSGAGQSSTVTVSAASSLAFSSGIGTFTLGSLAGTGSFNLADTGGAAIVLDVGGNGANTTYAGILSGNNGGAS